MLGVSAVLGSVAAGLLIGKLKMSRLSAVIAVLGAFIIPAGVAFLFPTGALARYGACVAAFCGAQLVACVFSIFAISRFQQKTPNHLIGKVMAYVSAISMCVQPLGQMVYGLLFDAFHGDVYLVLIPTGVIVCAIGFCTRGFFKELGENVAADK